MNRKRLIREESEKPNPTITEAQSVGLSKPAERQRMSDVESQKHEPLRRGRALRQGIRSRPAIPGEPSNSDRKPGAARQPRRGAT